MKNNEMKNLNLNEMEKINKEMGDKKPVFGNNVDVHDRLSYRILKKGIPLNEKTLRVEPDLLSEFGKEIEKLIDRKRKDPGSLPTLLVYTSYEEWMKAHLPDPVKGIVIFGEWLDHTNSVAGLWPLLLTAQAIFMAVFKLDDNSPKYGVVVWQTGFQRDGILAENRSEINGLWELDLPKMYPLLSITDTSESLKVKLRRKTIVHYHKERKGGKKKRRF